MREFSNETRWTPPSRARFIVPWRLLEWINEHSDVCWAGMVMWKLGYDWSWWPTRTCFLDGDYCGKFDGKPIPDLPDPIYITFPEAGQ